MFVSQKYIMVAYKIMKHLPNLEPLDTTRGLFLIHIVHESRKCCHAFVTLDEEHLSLSITFVPVFSF